MLGLFCSRFASPCRDFDHAVLRSRTIRLDYLNSLSKAGIGLAGCPSAVSPPPPPARREAIAPLLSEEGHHVFAD